MSVQPPPTWAPITDPNSSKESPAFNPVWLQYFLQLGATASAQYALQTPKSALVSTSQTTSPYTYTATALTTLVLGGTITATTYIRGGSSMAVSSTMFDVSPGDSVQITFTGTLTVGQIPR